LNGLLEVSRVIDAVNSWIGKWLSWLILATIQQPDLPPPLDFGEPPKFK
jgi:hypothetical protein